MLSYHKIHTETRFSKKSASVLSVTDIEHLQPAVSHMRGNRRADEVDAEKYMDSSIPELSIYFIQ